MTASGTVPSASFADDSDEAEDEVMLMFQVNLPIWRKRVKAGVQEWVMFFYPHITFSASLMNPIDDYSEPLYQEKCESRTDIDCTFIDLRPAFEGKQAQYLQMDGIHPNDAGSKVIADLMWAAMEENCATGLTISP